MTPSLWNLILKFIIPQLLKGQVVNPTPLSDKDRALASLKNKDGTVNVLLGTRDTGNTTLAYRLAEFFSRPTYAVTPEQAPPQWVTRINFNEVEERVPPMSTLVIDDLPVVMGNRDYRDQMVQTMEKIIPMVRHERKWHLIFCSQSSAAADKYILDCDSCFLKPLGILSADLERPAITRLYKEYVNPCFDGKSELFIKQHAYFISRTYRGLIKVSRT